MFGGARRSRAGWHTPCDTISQPLSPNEADAVPRGCGSTFPIHGGEGDEADGDDVQPRLGARAARCGRAGS